MHGQRGSRPLCTGSVICEGMVCCLDNTPSLLDIKEVLVFTSPAFLVSALGTFWDTGFGCVSSSAVIVL